MTNIFSRETFTDYEIDAMIREADSDNDGFVTYDGFEYLSISLYIFKYLKLVSVLISLSFLNFSLYENQLSLNVHF